MGATTDRLHSAGNMPFPNRSGNNLVRKEITVSPKNTKVRRMLQEAESTIGR